MVRMFTAYIVVAVFDDQHKSYFGPFRNEDRARQYAGSSDSIVDYSIEPLVIPHGLVVDLETRGRMTNKFEGISVSPNFERLHKQFVKKMAEAFQSYLDEHPTESDEFLEGQDVTLGAAKELFNDFLLYCNDGEELAEDMKVK